ncbi:MAG: homoserine O-acetyltransferase [Saprospiraceae bacterium]|nr:homoserine O-acetyltransferase [Saprospiraceae bacterium]
MHIYKTTEPFVLESGRQLPQLEVAYHTFGRLNERRDNVVWICHALTGSSDAADWWSGLVGEGKVFDPDEYFIVCSNMLGSCYGTTGPASPDPETEKKYGPGFPLITIRDMVEAHQHLARHLDIDQIAMAIGGSMGGQQVVEWAIMEPERFDKIALLATNARHSPWGIAFNEAQRMAIEAGLEKGTKNSGNGFPTGLEAARAVAMLSYRNYDAFLKTQRENSGEKVDDFLASSYQRYQGSKLQDRFDVFSYITLSKAMDTHNVGRGRHGAKAALNKIAADALVIGIRSDMLFPVSEQIFLANHIPGAQLELIDSTYGHDGFLIEYEIIGGLLSSFLQGGVFRSARSRYMFRERNRPGKSNHLPGTESF